MHKRWNASKVIQEIKLLEQSLGRRPVKRDNNSLYNASREFFGTWNSAMKYAGFKVKTNQVPIMPEKLDDNLAYFLGLLITDGHIVISKKYKKYNILLFTSYEEEKEMILTLIRKLFNYNSYVRNRRLGWNKRINHEIHISAKDLVYLFNLKYEIRSGNKSLTIRVPDLIFNSSNEIIANFLRGVIDGDGSIKRDCITISSGSEKFLIDLKVLLDKLNLKSGVISKDRTCYALNIGRVAGNLLKAYKIFYAKAEFYYPRKKLSLKSNVFKELI